MNEPHQKPFDLNADDASYCAEFWDVDQLPEAPDPWRGANRLAAIVLLIVAAGVLCAWFGGAS